MAVIKEKDRTGYSGKIFILSTLVAAGIPAGGFASKGSWVWFSLTVLCGLLLIGGRKLHWSWTGTPGLIWMLIAATRCSFLKIPPGWLLLSIVAALSLWDLHAFMGRIHRADQVPEAPDLERRHLKRLTMTSGLGLLLGGITLKVSMNIKFGWMLILGIALTIGLSRLIERMGRGDG
jgi:hypothetical protein